MENRSMLAIQFVEEIKNLYLKWLAINEPAFPTCCYSASEILCSYLQIKFNTGTLIISEKIDSSRNYNSHAQIKVGQETIDFTYFQFKTKKRKSLRSLDEKSLSEFCFGLQNGFVMNDKIQSLFNEKLELKDLRFQDEAKSSSCFIEYLELVRKSESFINYSIYNLVPREEAFWIQKK